MFYQTSPLKQYLHCFQMQPLFPQISAVQIHLNFLKVEVKEKKEFSKMIVIILVIDG